MWRVFAGAKEVAIMLLTLSVDSEWAAGSRLKRLIADETNFGESVAPNQPCLYPELNGIAELQNKLNDGNASENLRHGWWQGKIIQLKREAKLQIFLAAPQGFEPRYADPESAVLPLNEGATHPDRALFICSTRIRWCMAKPTCLS
jgi:hypothetical protein